MQVAKLSSSQWHRRLGHPYSTVVNRVIHDYGLSFVSDHNNSVCDACQMGKTHQLPFYASNNVGSSPLELIHSDVWGPALVSADGYKYYVSFIDSYSKFTWVYLLKRKSDVTSVFIRFRTQVERSLDRKIICIQSDWGVNIRVLILIFVTMAFNTVFPSLIPINKTAWQKENIVI